MKRVKALAVMALLFVFLTAGSAVVLAIDGNLAPTKAGQYTWKSVISGGGGFIDGIIYHPAEKGLVYLRTDMGGAYRWDTKEEKWVNITDMFGRDKADVPGVLSLALDPNDTNKVYMETGKYTQDWAGKGILIISNDRGNTYKEVPLEFKVGGNEDGRGAGERLAVDPNLGSVLFMGSTKNGLWKSADSGETWAAVAAFPAKNVNFVMFDRSSGVKGKITPRIFVSAAENSKSFYVSNDGGATWSLAEGAPRDLMAIRADMAGSDMVITFSDFPGPNGATAGAVYKYNTSTMKWLKLKLPDEQGGFSGISIDAQNPKHMLVSTLDDWGGPDGVYRTTDGGKTWAKKVKNAKFDYSYAPYVSHDFTPHWIAVVKIDPFDPEKAMWVTGYGLWATKNLSAKQCTWYFNDKNLEQTVPLQIISPPSRPAHLVSAMGDVDGFRHEDNMDVSPPDRHSPPRWSTLSVVCAWQEPMIMVKSMNKPPYGAISFDNGKTWTDFKTKPATAKAGGGTRSMAISADGKSIVWFPEKADLEYSKDNGSTWTKCGGGVPAVRPVADTVNPSKFYAYDATTGNMWVSNNGGMSFEKHGGQFQYVTKWTVDDCMAAVVPGFENHVWVTADTKGLYRTEDGGNNVTKIDGVDEAYRMGFGMAAPGNNYPAVFITGKIGGVYGFYRSDDAGKTWVRINDDMHQYGWIHCIIGDPRIYGRCYVSPEGRGVIYGDGTVNVAAAPIKEQPFEKTAVTVKEQAVEKKAEEVKEKPAEQAASAAVSGSGIVLWNFEDNTTGGWYGKGKWADACKINADPKFVSEGKYSMMINSKGSKGYDQDIAIFDGPFNENFGKCKAISMDVYVPKESIKGTEYLQIFIVISGAANSWYQIPQGLKAGWNNLKYPLESANMDGDLWHMYFVVNSNTALGGPIYIDNVKGLMDGDAGKVEAAAPAKEQPAEKKADEVKEKAVEQAAAPAATGGGIALWNFEDNTTGGWYGKGKWADACKVNADPKFVSEGKYSMIINSKGSKGYDQDIAMFDGPFNESFGKCKAITMDVYVPKESIKGTEYVQIFIVISGAANSWYQIPQGLKAGWNNLKYPLESASIDGDLWHMYFVVNSSTALGGPIYIDNVRGLMEGDAAKVEAAAPAKEQATAVPSKETPAAEKAAEEKPAEISGNKITLWNFEDNTTAGWYGKGKWAEACKVNADPKFVKEGKYSLLINSKGSKGYDQDIAIFDGPFNENFGKCKALTMDVYVPAETIKGLEYLQIFVVISGAANSWYQIPQGLKAGWNSLKYPLESASIDGDLWHMYFVVNSSAALGGPIYIDNVQGVL